MNLVHVVTVNLNAPALNAVTNSVSDVFTSADAAFAHAKELADNWVGILADREGGHSVFEAREFEQESQLRGFWIYRNNRIIGRIISNSRELKG